MTGPLGPDLDLRDDPVEYFAREIQLHGATDKAMMFLEASRPYRSLGSQAMLFFDPVLRSLFGGGSLAMQRVMAARAPRRDRRRAFLPRLRGVAAAQAALWANLWP
jgi:hypothetical protein